MVQLNFAPEIGGGAAYSNKITENQADRIVRSAGELVNALEGARAGQIIYVPGDTSIDISGRSRVSIGADGVVLASNRGVGGSRGALIHSDDESTTNTAGFINSSRDNIRVTGIRWRGNNPNRFDPGSGNHHSRATEALHMGQGANGWQIDNCEMWAWTGQALNCWGNGHYIHHNYMHHCQMDGLGYGMELQEGHHYVMCNIFDKCRHDIAAVGRPGNGYTARQNVCGTTNNEYGHAFDMHGFPEGGDLAGAKVLIEQNTMMRREPSGRGNTMQDSQIHIRGIPSESVVVRNNWFRHRKRPSGTGDRHLAWWQSSVGGTLKKMSVQNNHYGMDSAPPPGVGAATGAATIEFDD